MNTIDKILVFLAGFFISFTISMIVIFCIFQSIPDTLVQSVFGVLGGEIILTFAIWWIKKKYGGTKK
jgi:cytochrome c biogenesis protein CcdA